MKEKFENKPLAQIRDMEKEEEYYQIIWKLP